MGKILKSGEGLRPDMERRSAWRDVLHWAVALSPFALVLALSVWGYGRYAWIPFVAGVLCPLGLVLTAWQVKRDRKAR